MQTETVTQSIKVKSARGPRKPTVKERQVRLTRQTKAVQAYLSALGGDIKPEKPETHVRSASIQTLGRRLEALDLRLQSELTPVGRLLLLQKRASTKKEMEEAVALSSRTNPDSIERVKKAFIDVALDFSERHGITYTTWRQMNVPATILKAAGLRPERPQRNGE